MIVYIVQQEHGGIPQEPEPFTTKEGAFSRYRDLAVEMGFSDKEEGESWEDYRNRFIDWEYDGDGDFSEQCVRIWGPLKVNN